MAAVAKMMLYEDLIVNSIMNCLRKPDVEVQQATAEEAVRRVNLEEPMKDLLLAT